MIGNGLLVDDLGDFGDLAEIGHSKVRMSRPGSPEGSIRVSHVFAPQCEAGRTRDRLKSGSLKETASEFVP